MPDCWGKSYVGTGIFAISQPAQFGIGIPASWSVRYRRSRSSLALASYAHLYFRHLHWYRGVTAVFCRAGLFGSSLDCALKSPSLALILCLHYNAVGYGQSE